MLLLLLAQVLGPESCVLSGLCQVPDPGPRIPSGIMYAALGLVAAGVVGIRVERARRRRTPPSSPEQTSGRISD